jgi:hypothetical protein
MDLFKQTKKDRDYLALQELLKPIEEQDEATGILSKPKKAEDEETMVTGFFSSVFDRSKQRSAELAKEMQEQQRIAEQDINDYLRSTVVSDALYDELKLPNPAYGGLKLVEDRPLTEEELQQYAPLLDLANDIMEENITVEELGAMNKSDQEAMLKSLGDLGSLKRGSSFEGDTFEVASSREEFMRDLMKLREKQNATTPDVDERSKLKEFLLREETDSTTADVEPVDTTTIDADGGAAPSGKGIMSPRLNEKGETSFYNPDVVTKEGKAGLKEAQKVLKGLGYYKSSIDGVTGANTSNAIKVYQYDNDLEVTGELDSATKKKLSEGGTSVPKPENELLASISEHEGGYGAANNGTSSLAKKFSVSGTYYSDNYNKPLTEMTVNEILNAQNGTTGKTDAELLELDPETRTAQRNREFFAVGAYQIIPITMKKALQEGAISGDEVFSPELQDRIALQFLAGSDKPKLRAYIRGEEGASLDDAAMALAEQWASFPVPRDVRNDKGEVIATTGGSRYGSGNRALHDLTSTKNMLKSVRKAFTEQVQTAVP